MPSRKGGASAMSLARSSSLEGGIVGDAPRADGAPDSLGRANVMRDEQVRELISCRGIFLGEGNLYRPPNPAEYAEVGSQQV